MNLNALLRSIGLSYKEAELYLAALTIGPASILALSKESRVHRTLVYQIIDQLVAKGVMTSISKGKRKLYAPVEPKELLNLVKRREQDLKDALPELNAISKGQNEAPRVRYYEGKAQLQELFRTGLTAKKKEMLSFFPSKYMADIFGKREMEQIITDRVNRKIQVKTLRSQSGENEFSGSEKTDEAYRQIRYIPESQVFETGIVIFDDKVNLFAPTTENFGIQIQSASFAKLLSYLFEQAWERSTERTKS